MGAQAVDRRQGTKALQSWLNALGARLTVDGVVGPRTTAALATHGDEVADNILVRLQPARNETGDFKSQYLPVALRIADEYGVSRRLAEKVIDLESLKWDPKSFNPNGGGFGAIGLMQLRKGGAFSQYKQDVDPSLTEKDIWDPETNLRVGIWYLRWCAQFIKRPAVSSDVRDHAHIYAAYNLGVGAYRSLFSSDRSVAQAAIQAQAAVLQAGGVDGYIKAVERALS